MKKFYKPLARAEKASQIFKKKTLNVNDNLNVKYDDDDIENVEDYWNTAVSVIGNSTIDSIDQSNCTEVSDTLFNINNIRKSIRSTQKDDVHFKRHHIQSIEIHQNGEQNRTTEYFKKENESNKIIDNHIMKENDTIIDDSFSPVEHFEDDDAQIQPWNNLNEVAAQVREDDKQAFDCLLEDEESFGDDNNLNTFDDEKLKKKIKDHSDNSDDEYELNNVNKNIDDNAKNTVGIKKPKTNNPKLENNCNNSISNETDGDNNDNLFDMQDPSYSDSPNLFPIDVSNHETNHTQININESEDKSKATLEMQTLKTFATKKADSSPAKKKNVEKSSSNKKGNHSFVIEKVLTGMKNNTISPLVCSKTMDTAIMTLDYLAYSNDFKTPNSFSIFVIKGKIQISVNGNLKIATKGDITIVAKDDVFSFSCLSKNGANLFLSYAL